MRRGERLGRHRGVEGVEVREEGEGGGGRELVGVVGVSLGRLMLCSREMM